MEQWREVPGFPGYMVSDMGRIKGRRPAGRIMQCPRGANGYLRVCLSDRKCHLVHRLVLLAFIGESSLQVNHKNGEKADNRLSNLEYCTGSENQKHSWDTLGRKHWADGMKGRLNPLSRPVVSIDNDGRTQTFENARHAVECGGATNQFHVNSCCNGKRKTHAGKAWAYTESVPKWQERLLEAAA